jgi:hypothetical protein
MKILLLSIVGFLLIFKTILSLVLPNILINVLSFGTIFYYFISSTQWLQPRGKYRSLNQIIAIYFFITIIFTVVGALLTPARMVINTMVQFLFPTLCLSVFLQLTTEELIKLSKIIFIYLSIIMTAAIVELFIPPNVRLILINLALMGRYSENGLDISQLGMGAGFQMTSFSDISIPIMRLGSLTCEPITFGYLSLVYFTLLLFRHRGRYTLVFSYLLHFLSLAKSAIVNSILMLISQKIKRHSIKLVTVFILFIIVYLITISDVSDRTLIRDNIQAHGAGAINGFHAAILSPLTGKGFGTAGYANFISSGFDSIVVDSSSNESGLGIMLFQTGLIYTGLFLATYFLLCIYSLQKKSYRGFGFIIGYVLSFLFSESLWSMTITFTVNLMIIIFLKFDFTDNPQSLSSPT